MRALVLGGTRFLGRAIVDALLAADHEPTLFNRGLTQPELFPDVEKLRGDRSADLSALEGREWDAVLDVAAYFPHEVRRSVEALRGRVGRYVFVSSVSVYADHSVPQAEGDAVAELAPGDETDDGPETYGARKAACERIVVEEFGDAALVARPGLIVGPHDPTGRFTYWPHRVARGGEVLAPASPDYAVQFIDVRDLAALDRRSQRPKRRRRDVQRDRRDDASRRPARECIRVTGSDARLIWVPSDELLEAGAEEWMGVPLWIVSPGWEAVNRVPVSKALAAGLTLRPLADTIRGAPLPTQRPSTASASRPSASASCSALGSRSVGLEDYPRVDLLFGPSPSPPARAAERAPRRRSRDLGEARGLQLGPRVRRQQGPQARVPRRRRACPGLRHARFHRRRPVEPHAPGGCRRRLTLASPCVLVQEHWVDWDDPGYETVGNILLSRIMGADVRLSAAGFDIGIRASWEEALASVREAGGKPYAIPAGASDHPLGGLGFARWADEVADQEQELDVFFDTSSSAPSLARRRRG